MKKNKRGVSLIVLVITIIVIIILAAAVILTINNNNPMNNANIARYTSDRANVQDALSAAIGKIAGEKLCTVTIPAQADIASGIVYTLSGANDGIVGGIIGWDTLAIGEPADYEKITILGMKLPSYGSTTRWFVNSNGDVSVEVAGITYGPVETLNGGTRNKEEAKWNVPYVPVGFSYGEGTVDAGYVIQDNSGNQYVWVPVDGIHVTYEKDLTYPIVKPSVDDISGLPTLKYGGFYVGRYEAGKEDEKVVIKKNATIWNNINYSNAKIESQKVKNTYHYEEGMTNLLTGTQWDTLMKWLGTKDINGENDVNVRDSISWGNYHDSGLTEICGKLQTAGKSEKWKAKNIYDIAGNVWEWTDEKYDSSYHINRGGSFYDSGYACPSGYRNYSTVGNDPNLGFRVALYF